MNRLFLGVPVPLEAGAALAATLPRLPGRPVPSGNLHLTIRFLGDVDKVTRDRLSAALDESDLSGGFEVVLGEMGAFPRPAKASVLWIAIAHGRRELIALNGVVEEACDLAGLEPEDRPYSPHLTISRIRPEVDVRPLLLSYRPEPIKWKATELILYETRLDRGTVYVPLEQFPL
ncbi:MAG: RNA 2',3'-cyclic phosphodiesterase [Acidimicrobiia bacterium]